MVALKCRGTGMPIEVLDCDSTDMSGYWHIIVLR